MCCLSGRRKSEADDLHPHRPVAHRRKKPEKAADRGAAKALVSLHIAALTMFMAKRSSFSKSGRSAIRRRSVCPALAATAFAVLAGRANSCVGCLSNEVENSTHIPQG